MTRWFNFILQVCGFASQVVLPTFVFNPHTQAIAYGATAATVAAIQAVAALTAHSYNPDGTPATTAYVPPK